MKPEEKPDYFWVVQIHCNSNEAEQVKKLLSAIPALGHYEILWEKGNDSFQVTKQLSLYDYFFSLKFSKGELELRLEIIKSTLEFPNDFNYSIARLGTSDYEEAFRKNFSSFSIDEKVLIYPPWEQEELIKNKKSQLQHNAQICIQPGMAFGTGQHESTQMCLIFLYDYLPKIIANHPNMNILEIGCGSGVLSIFSAIQGASVLALDISWLAVENTIENIKLNQKFHANKDIAAKITCKQGDFEFKDCYEQEFDFFIGNLTAAIISQNLSSLEKMNIPKGIFSGIYQNHEKKIDKLIEESSLQTIQKEYRNEWVLYYWEKR